MRYLTSADKPVGDQFSYWRDVICQVCTPLAAERSDTAGGLTGWVRAAEVGSTHAAEVCSQTQSLAHGPAEIRRMQSADVFVSLQLQGTCVATQGARTCQVAPGGFAMFDTTVPYRLAYSGHGRGDEWRVLSFRVPRARLLPLIANPGGFTAVTHDGAGVAGMVASTMTSLWQNVEALDDLAAQSAETALLTLLAAAAGGGVHEESRETLDAALRAAVNRYLTANLQDSLAATDVAGRFGISVRKLHGLYERTDATFAQTVMTLRVEACARDLSVGTGRTLTETAAWWGFSDLSHMNRVFRARFGCLPSEFRRSAVADQRSC